MAQHVDCIFNNTRCFMEPFFSSVSQGQGAIKSWKEWWKEILAIETQQKPPSAGCQIDKRVFSVTEGLELMLMGLRLENPKPDPLSLLSWENLKFCVKCEMRSSHTQGVCVDFFSFFFPKSWYVNQRHFWSSPVVYHKSLLLRKTPSPSWRKEASFICTLNVQRLTWVGIDDFIMSSSSSSHFFSTKESISQQSHENIQVELVSFGFHLLLKVSCIL